MCSIKSISLACTGLLFQLAMLVIAVTSPYCYLSQYNAEIRAEITGKHTYITNGKRDMCAGNTIPGETHTYHCDTCALSSSLKLIVYILQLYMADHSCALTLKRSIYFSIIIMQLTYVLLLNPQSLCSPSTSSIQSRI